MSSSNECGRITNRTSTRWGRVIICPKVIDTCRSAMRQRTGGPLPSRAIPIAHHTAASDVRTHAIPPLSIAVLALLVSPFSDTEARAQAPQGHVFSTLERTVDPRVKPGDDFFAYANGAWLKAAVIPAGRDRWAVRDEINERTRRQVESLLDEARTARPGSLARKVADFRAALLNQPAIEKTGLAALAPTFARIDGVADKLALTRLLGSTMRADVDPLDFGVYTSSSVLGLAVEHSIHGERNYSAFLLQGGLALGNRDLYRDPVELGRLHQTVVRALTLAGFDRASQRAGSVVALEEAIAETWATSQASAVDRNADVQWSRADFARQAPGMDWNAFFDAAGIGPQQVVVPWQPSAVKGVASLVAARSLDTWKDYLRFHAVYEYAAPQLLGDKRTRAEGALALTQTTMADAIGELYAARYFSSVQKGRVRTIIANVAAAFREHVARAPWLSANSRKIALEKLDRL